MTTRRPAAAQPLAQKLLLDPAAIKRGIARLGERIDELRAFNVASVPKGSSPELTALSAAIQDTLVRCFGENTSAYKRFESATSLNFRPGVFSNNYPLLEHYQEGAQKNIAQAVLMLQEAQRALNEDLADATQEVAMEPASSSPEPLSRRVFVVHGHDGEAREIVASFLRKLDFEPIILHEQANQGRTVIEKVEAHGDVGFAVVLLTPDDEGCAKGGKPEPRARQNVLLELGFFIGRLGREKVCALKRGTLEIPSDFAGVVWEKMDDGNGWKLSLARELKAAGHAVDLNKAF
ncbi:TIR domain-containing protein [Cupriavidus sp. CuC1]|uniref:TIR domain-containing protein n=1 Tax=Cupriavidus sp. CuC1 TaxID=3373131 RepID=UPI0037D50452